MSEPTVCAAACSCSTRPGSGDVGEYCVNCDLLVGLPGLPCFGRAVRVRWRKRTWTCLDSACPVGTFTEQDEQVPAPRALLTARACRWAIEQIRGEHASVQGLARRLGTT